MFWALTPADDVLTRPEWIAFVRATMVFLDKWTTRAVRVEDEAWTTIVPYVLGPLVFEVSIEWREENSSLLVGRTVNGRRPPGYYMHEGRRIVKGGPGPVHRIPLQHHTLTAKIDDRYAGGAGRSHARSLR